MNISLLSEEELQHLRQLIANAKNIVICAHKVPDGDALGSSLAWAEYLRSVGKFPQIVVPDAFPDFLHWLPNSEKIIRYDKKPGLVTSLFEEADLVFCLDFNATSRVEDMEPLLLSSKATKVVVDHHLNPTIEADLVVSHTELSSTSELIFRLVWQLGGFEALGKHFAVPVYCGMMTDTGGFTYNSSYPEIFFIISELLTKRIDKDRIYRNVFNNYSHHAIKLRGYLMAEKLRCYPNLHASYFILSREEMRNFHFIKGDIEGLVNEPLRIKGNKLSISLRQDDRKDNLVWVSLRSVDDFPANEVAARFFNGGGHKNASGGRLNCSIEEAEQVVQQAIQAYAEQLMK